MNATQERLLRSKTIMRRHAVETLEHRSLMDCGFSQVGNTLKITADNDDNEIEIFDSGSEVEVTCDGETETFEDVENIRVVTKRGDDMVSYTLEGDPVGHRGITIDTNSGDDTVTINAEGAEVLGSLDITVRTHAGEDVVEIGLNDLVTDPFATVAVNVNGGTGNDTLAVEISGFDTYANSIDVLLDGRSGDDVLSVSALFSGYSWPDYLTVDLRGGTDQFHMCVEIEDEFFYGLLDLRIDGGSGYDEATTGVTVGEEDFSDSLAVRRVEDLLPCEEEEE